jgi:hypothetical protein
MNEAKEMYRDLMNALLPILPHKVYGDIRRVVNLVWAIVGVCLTQTVRLEAWGEILESRAHYAASRVRRFARFLHNPAIDPHEWYKPLIQSVLKDWPAGRRLYIALDTTALTPFVLIRVLLLEHSFIRNYGTVSMHTPSPTLRKEPRNRKVDKCGKKVVILTLGRLVCVAPGRPTTNRHINSARSP